MKKHSLILSILLLAGIAVHAQGITTLYLDNSTHNTTQAVGSDGTRIIGCPQNASGYDAGVDYWVTITGNCTAPHAFSFTIEDLNLRRKSNGQACEDTVFIYDGAGITAPLLWYATGDEVTPTTFTVYASPNNVAQALTVRLKSCTTCSSWSPSTGSGFTILVGCKFPCETFTPHLDSIFYKTRNGEIYDFGRIKIQYDSTKVWDATVNDSVWTYTPFEGVNLCIGDGVIFTAHCDYTTTTGWYTPSDATTTFTWDMGTNGDIFTGVGMTTVYYDEYLNLSCYDVVLGAVDANGCETTTFPTVKVRVAKNPLKTLFPLADICNRDSLFVNMGYDGDNATLTLEQIEYEEVKTQTNDIRTFIPDGPNCAVQCYKAPVTFNDFPSGRSVESADDICSICINFEHSFMGDYQLAILCPSNGAPGMPAGHGKSVLKYKDSCPAGKNCPPGTTGGSGRFTGIPYGGNDNDNDNYDGAPSGCNSGSGTNTPQCCDSSRNAPGWGWNYCFSRNEDYTLVNGLPANTPNPNNAGMANGPTVNVTHTFAPIPAGYYMAGTTCGTVTVTTLDSSDHENKSNYYTPANNFSELIGCPLNGTWNIEVCDNWGIDNGWVFSWSLDICNVNNTDCRYQVPIDSIVWEADHSPQYCDYELGHYRGAEVHKHNDLEAYILTPDTAGTFRINVTIYDAFGCVWDTNTRITSYWTPQPNLGDDTNLCGINQINIDATDRHTLTQNYSYVWEPYGQSTPVVTTEPNPTGDVRYVVEVTNSQGYGLTCSTRDTIDVHLRHQPMPSFIPEPFTFEGCDPLTLTFMNHSIDGTEHHWVFGDGITSDLESPTHTYSAGLYDLKYYVTSYDGCVDSLILDKAIAVFPSPKPAFSWDPIYPTVLDPVIHLENRTTPQDNSTKYFWEVQYNRDNPLSVETLTGRTPTYNFGTFATVDELPGNYTVRLISRTDNMAPSGNIVQCQDTTENTVLLINDYLQFPNVVTPNGDGVNDVFAIKGLADGFGYPVNSLYIYNKWGTMVFHKDNISSEADYWDPSGVPAGTYFYRFTAHGYKGNVEHNGAIEVIK